MEMKGEEINKAYVAASFQKAVVEFLVDNAMKACKIKKVNKIAVAGGVASNSCLRSTLINRGRENDIEVLFPEPILCTDNAAMIGSAAYFEFLKGRVSSMELNAVPNLKLGQR
ncbi:tRNA N6-adenosine threonylcarbamoyltransferase [bioreactor metagenome]|uniref:tRNA N6-adenosine threonylcarbamoyltransferase n=1 Tax=bioreactor metagenome TaxID=1076179 RepID=A0A645HX85_9ZZZZ